MKPPVVHVVKPSGGIYLEPVNPPEDSWWLCDRETFQQRLSAETPRMTRSRFGRQCACYTTRGSGSDTASPMRSRRNSDA
jgi:hypothetical protein